MNESLLSNLFLFTAWNSPQTKMSLSTGNVHGPVTQMRTLYVHCQWIQLQRRWGCSFTLLQLSPSQLHIVSSWSTHGRWLAQLLSQDVLERDTQCSSVV